MKIQNSCASEPCSGAYPQTRGAPIDAYLGKGLISICEISALILSVGTPLQLRWPS